MYKVLCLFLLLGSLIVSSEAANVGGADAVPQLPYPRVYAGDRAIAPQAFYDCNIAAVRACKANEATVAEPAFYYVFNLPTANAPTNQLYKVGVSRMGDFLGNRYATEYGHLRARCEDSIPEGGDHALRGAAIEQCIRLHIRFTSAVGCWQNNACMDHYWRCGIEMNNADPHRAITITHSPVPRGHPAALLPPWFGHGASEFYHVTDQLGATLPLDQSWRILTDTIGRFTQADIDVFLDCNMAVRGADGYNGVVMHDGSSPNPGYLPSTVPAMAVQAVNNYRATIPPPPPGFIDKSSIVERLRTNQRKNPTKAAPAPSKPAPSPSTPAPPSGKGKAATTTPATTATTTPAKPSGKPSPLSPAQAKQTIDKLNAFIKEIQSYPTLPTTSAKLPAKGAAPKGYIPLSKKSSSSSSSSSPAASTPPSPAAKPTATAPTVPSAAKKTPQAPAGVLQPPRGKY